MRASPVVVLALPLLTACGIDYATAAQSRVLDSFPYVDCGIVSPGGRAVCTVPLFSEGNGKVTVFDVRSTDLALPQGGALGAGAFIVAPLDWRDPECGDGDCRELTRYDDNSDDDTLALPVIFAPQVEGYYQAELTIWSNDTESLAAAGLPDDPDTERSIWKVQLRGVAKPACSRVVPRFIDFGRRPVGGDFSQPARIESCGIVGTTVGGYTESGTGAEEVSLYNSFPVYVLPGLSESITVGWTVGSETAGAPTPVEDSIVFTSNAEQLATQPLVVIGNDCEQSVHPSWDADADGWLACGGDCDDARADTSPTAPELPGNGRDEDCDGLIDEAPNPQGTDNDGDGTSELQGDCDDADPAIGAHASEVLDHLDNNCDGRVDEGTERTDDDADGWSEREGDCDDANRLVSPDIPETVDGIDNDCDGIVDEGSLTVDDDADGAAEQGTATVDCDDGDPWVYVGAFEFCDGYDNDCDGVTDEGADDAPDAACAFLPRRKEADTGLAEQGAGGGCSTTGGGASVPVVGVLLAAVAAVSGRRRSRRVSRD